MDYPLAEGGTWSMYRGGLPDGTVSALVHRVNRDFPPLNFFRILSRSLSHSIPSLSFPKIFRGGAAMTDPFWEDQPGSTNSNWFKDHPKITLMLLCGVIVLIVAVSL